MICSQSPVVLIQIARISLQLRAVVFATCDSVRVGYPIQSSAAGSLVLATRLRRAMRLTLPLMVVERTISKPDLGDVLCIWCCFARGGDVCDDAKSLWDRVWLTVAQRWDNAGYISGLLVMTKVSVGRTQNKKTFSFSRSLMVMDERMGC